MTNEERDVLGVEARALEIAEKLVLRAFPHNKQAPGSMPGTSVTVDGDFWEGIDRKDQEAVKVRLREMADLIGDLKRRMLTP